MRATITAYFSNKQLLLFAFAFQYKWHPLEVSWSNQKSNKAANQPCIAAQRVSSSEEFSRYNPHQK